METIIYWGVYRNYYKGSIPPFPTKNQTVKGLKSLGFRV